MFRISVLKKFANSTESTCVGDKVAIPKVLLKRDFNTGVTFAKLLRTTFFTEQFQCLLLTYNSYFQRSPEGKPVKT